MSRLAQHPKAQPAASKKATSALGATQDEICPVCKSSRYLNANLRFLVNPECYHKMCESCVDRIFSHGPAPCPLPGCGRTLRKHRFREQTFEDIKVEREVDIRRRIAAVFNKREDDFEDLRSYNDYLNEVEDITFNLVNNIDVDANNARLEQYQKAHQDEIRENANLEQQEKASHTAQQKQEREAAKLRREAARREEEEERRELAESRREIIQKLASDKTGNNADKIAKQGQQVQLKRRLDRQAAAERQRQLQAADITQPAPNHRFKGLKSRAAPEPEAPIDAFGGLSFHGRKYHALQPEYVWQGIQEPSKDSLLQAGGYDVKTFETRALCEAFAGLGVFVADETMEHAKAREDNAVVATQRAAIGARDVRLEDPF
ncbi:hypothetical protein AMS68_007497 [Peltaster fructicola]|uniref:RNA polymerase II transcription factor B subunit 3 n=1 Tax=Peltaster fructicola TaxID=286661 RepID=A0A6H0Y5W0_9PEZI|nr:hypothetical protein AMS68_007497 [Peltaster fructicola]